MGTIEKRGKHSWRIGTKVMTDKGWKWVRETIKYKPDMSETKQRKEAQKALARLELAVEEGNEKPSHSQHTVRSFSELWLAQHVKPNLQPTTYDTYRHFLNTRILPSLGNIPLKSLTPLRIVEWLNEVRESPRRSTALPEEKLKNPRRPSVEKRLKTSALKDQPLSPRTVRHYYDTLCAILDKAVQWEVINKNPCEKVDRPIVKKASTNCLTEERAIELLRCLRHEENMCYRAAVLLALLCGLRLGEVGALRLTDIDWEHNMIDITRALKYTRSKGSYEGDPKSESSARPNRLVVVARIVRVFPTI